MAAADKSTCTTQRCDAGTGSYEMLFFTTTGNDAVKVDMVAYLMGTE